MKKVVFLMLALSLALAGVSLLYANSLPAQGVVKVKAGITPLGPGYADGISGSVSPEGIEVDRHLYRWHSIIYSDDPEAPGGFLFVEIEHGQVHEFSGVPCIDGICPYPQGDPFEASGEVTFAYRVSIEPIPPLERPPKTDPRLRVDTPLGSSRVETVGLTLTVGGSVLIGTGYNQQFGSGALDPESFTLAGHRLALSRFHWTIYLRRFSGALEAGMVWPAGVSLDSVTVDGAVHTTSCYIESDRTAFRCGNTGFSSPWSFGDEVQIRLRLTIPADTPPPTPTSVPTPGPSIQTTALGSPGIDRTQWRLDSRGTLHGELIPPDYTPVTTYEFEWRPIGSQRLNNERIPSENFTLNIPYDGVPSYVIEVRVRAEYDPGSSITSADRTDTIDIPAADDPWVTVWSPWVSAIIDTPQVQEVVEGVPEVTAAQTGLRDAVSDLLRTGGVGSVQASDNLASIMLGTGWILVTLGVAFFISMATGGSGISWFAGGVVGMGVWSVAAPFGDSALVWAGDWLRAGPDALGAILHREIGGPMTSGFTSDAELPEPYTRELPNRERQRRFRALGWRSTGTH